MNQEQNIWLEATQGLIQGQKLPIDQGQITFGRTAQNDVVLAEQAISRQHARIFFENNQLWITDLGSKNGTMVNKKTITPHQNVAIHPNDSIQLGSTILHVIKNPSSFTHISRADPGPKKNTTLARLKANPLPDFLAKGKSFKLPPINRRVVLYGGMVFVLLVLVISSSSKRQKNQTPSLKSTYEKQTITIPDHFQTDSDQIQKIPTLEEVELLISQAQSAIRFEDYHTAIRLYEQILKVRPEDEKIIAYYNVAKQNLYRKIQINRNIAIIEVEKLNFEKAMQHWQRIAELTQGLDPERYNEAQEQIKSLRSMIENPS
ncbi:MAG: FHA domain-containing protein [Bdellovibrionota bacterium]|nr:FHA domain-containing protein [Deltaproteobacteria bacterium]